MMHSALHEAAVLFSGTAHVTLRMLYGPGLWFLREGKDRATCKKHEAKKSAKVHEAPREGGKFAVMFMIRQRHVSGNEPSGCRAFAHTEFAIARKSFKIRCRTVGV